MQLYLFKQTQLEHMDHHVYQRRAIQGQDSCMEFLSDGWLQCRRLVTMYKWLKLAALGRIISRYFLSKVLCGLICYIISLVWSVNTIILNQWKSATLISLRIPLKNLSSAIKCGKRRLASNHVYIFCEIKAICSNGLSKRIFGKKYAARFSLQTPTVLVHSNSLKGLCT